MYNTYEYIDRIVNNYGDKRNLVGHKGKTDHISRDSRTETVVGYICSLPVGAKNVLAMFIIFYLYEFLLFCNDFINIEVNQISSWPTVMVFTFG